LGARIATALSEVTDLPSCSAKKQEGNASSSATMFLIALRHTGKLKDERQSPISCCFRLSHYESWVIGARCGTVATEIFLAARSRGEGAALSRNLQNSTST